MESRAFSRVRVRALYVRRTGSFGATQNAFVCLSACMSVCRGPALFASFGKTKTPPHAESGAFCLVKNGQVNSAQQDPAC